MSIREHIADAPEWLLQLLRQRNEKATFEYSKPQLNGSHIASNDNLNSNAEKYAQVALKNQIELLSSSGKGERNEQLFKTAAVLHEFVNAGALSQSEVESRVLDACHTNGLVKDDGLKSVQQTIASARKKVAGKARQIPEVPKKRLLRSSAARAYIRGEDAPVEEAKEESDDKEEIEKHPYGVSSGRIFFAVEKTNRQNETTTSYIPICDMAAHIAEEITTEEGARSFRVEGRTANGRPFEFEIGAEAFADDKQLKAALTAAAGAQSPVRKGMAGHLAPAIQLLTGELIQGRRFGRTGWADNKFLIPGREPEHTEITLPRKLPYRFDANVDLQKGLEALRCLLRAQRSTVAAVATAFAFQPPLALHAGWRNERAALFIAGRSGSLKSSWSCALMCLYGSGFIDDANIVKWGEGATRNAIMSFATHCHDVPFLIDNYKPTTGGGARDFVNLIHNILEGGEKDRLNRAAQMRDSKAVFCWPLITGEDVPDTDAAALARVLIVPFSWTAGADNPPLTQAQLLSPHLCAVGRAWIDWIESDDGQSVVKNIGALFNIRRALWIVELKKRRSDMVNINRVASNLASNQLTWEIMEACPALSPIVKEFSHAHADGLIEVSGGMANYTAESLEATRYLEALRQLLATERFVLVGRSMNIPADAQNRVLGWEDDDGIYLLPDLAYRAVSDLLKDVGGLGGFTKNSLNKQLDSLGVIASKGKDSIVGVKKCSGSAQRVLHLKTEAIRFKEENESEYI